MWPRRCWTLRTVSANCYRGRRSICTTSMRDRSLSGRRWNGSIGRNTSASRHCTNEHDAYEYAEHLQGINVRVRVRVELECSIKLNGAFLLQASLLSRGTLPVRIPMSHLLLLFVHLYCSTLNPLLFKMRMTCCHHRHHCHHHDGFSWIASTRHGWIQPSRSSHSNPPPCVPSCGIGQNRLARVSVASRRILGFGRPRNTLQTCPAASAGVAIEIRIRK
mmetsp:Transcript_13924/g.38263  ORF Transcript_13924/g.38263 Transcript_13924/m.38263 type:complete len:219 (+) Transcript_13924:412-1068(+)